MPASVFLAGMLLSCMSFAENAVKEPVQTPPATVSSLSNWPLVLLVLLGMIGFIFALAWFVKRFGGMGLAGNRDIKVLSAIAVGTRERISLIDVNGKQFLIGVTTHQITHLHSFDEAIVKTNSTDPSLRQSDFLSKLQVLMNSPKKTTRADESHDNTSETQTTVKRDENAH